MIVKQFFLILAALFLGFILSTTLNLPIPANVLGFVILFAALCLGVIKINDVDKICDFIIKYLSVFFVVPTVGIMVYFELIGKQFLHILVPLLMSILLGYFVAGKVTEIFINLGEKKKLTAKKNHLGGGNYE